MLVLRLFSLGACGFAFSPVLHRSDPTGQPRHIRAVQVSPGPLPDGAARYKHQQQSGSALVAACCSALAALSLVVRKPSSTSGRLRLLPTPATRASPPLLKLSKTWTKRSVSAVAFSPTHGISRSVHRGRRAYLVLKLEDPVLSPVPMGTKAKQVLVPAIGYAGLAGVALGAHELVAATGGRMAIMGLPLPGATLAAVVVPALVLCGEFVLLGGGERVAKMMGGHPGDKELVAICSRVAERAGLPPPAHVYEIPTSELNAFAAGFGHGDATVAVTSGLRRALSTRELAAVIAHEMGHIRHSDMSTNMHAAIAIAGLGGLYEMGRMLHVQRDDNDSDDDDADGKSLGLTLMVGGATTRALAQLLKLSISRSAEYDADRVAAELCGADAMISALSKIEQLSATAPRDQLAARGEAFAHAYISNGPSGVPQKASGLRRAWAKLERLCSTHPSTDDRIAALRRADALAQKK
jgi:heat shock protein HtpX